MWNVFTCKSLFKFPHLDISYSFGFHDSNEVPNSKKKSQVLYHFCYRAQVVGWPPIRSFRKNSMATQPPKNTDDADGKLGSGCLYVKVSMDGAPYLRKVDLKTYGSYVDLSSALEKMFSSFTIGILFEASPADLGWFSIFNNSCP